MNFDPTQTGDSVAEAHEKVVLSNAADFAMGGLRRAGNFFRPRRLVDAAQTVGAAAIAGALLATKVLVHATGEALAAVSTHGDTKYSGQQANETERTTGSLGEKQKAFIKQWLPEYEAVEKLNVEHAEALSVKIVSAIGGTPNDDRKLLLKIFFMGSDLGIDYKLDIELNNIADALNRLTDEEKMAIVDEVLGVEPDNNSPESIDPYRAGLENAMVKAEWDDAEKRSLLKLLGMDYEIADVAEVNVRVALEKIDRTLAEVKQGYAEDDNFNEWYALLLSVIKPLLENQQASINFDEDRLTIETILEREHRGKFTKFDYQKDSVATEVRSLFGLRDKYKTRHENSSNAREQFVELSALVHISLMNVDSDGRAVSSDENSINIEEYWYNQDARRNVIKLIKTFVKQNNRKKDEQQRLSKMELSQGEPIDRPRKRTNPKKHQLVKNKIDNDA